MNRSLFGKRDILIFAGLLVFAAVFYFLYAAVMRTEGGAAQIMYDGQVVRALDLSRNTSFALDQKPEVRFSVRNGAVAFIESNCPDKVCIRSGYLQHPGQMAACLPNKVSLEIVGSAEPNEHDVDVVAQ